MSFLGALVNRIRRAVKWSASPVQAEAVQGAYFTPTYNSPMVPEDVVAGILSTCMDYSMVHPSGVEFLIHDTVRLIRGGVPGVIVECGVWKGGASLAALLAQRHAFGRVERSVYLLDSFEGLPPVKEKDGPLAADWQRGEDAERFLDNCRAAARHRCSR